MISLASRGDSSPAAQAVITADDALGKSAALSILSMPFQISPKVPK
jgi:hypothetical protein